MQLLKWYGGLLHGDFGRSLLMGQPVMEVTMQRLPVTLALSIYALVLTLVLGLIGGIFAALRQNTWVDQAAMMFSMFGISVPNFFLGLLMIFLFAVYLGWLPTGGYIPLTQDPVGWLRTSHHAGDIAGAAAGWAAGAHHPLDHAWKCCARTTSAPRAPRACRGGWWWASTRWPMR